jgi:3-oxoacyl-[acyl-carrier protein] reductase
MDRAKTALVTGGSRGLGAEVSVALGRAGYKVAVNYRAGASLAEEVATRTGPAAVALKADVADAAQVEAMAEAIARRWGRLDVLVNNAGITRDALLPRLSEEDWDKAIRVNLKGCFNTARALAPLMRGSGGGHIVNVSSRSGLSGNAGQAAYSASKAAILGLTKSLAAELGEYYVRVNAVLPGYMPTDMGGGSPAAMERAMKESLLGRLSEPAEAASFIVWLAGTRGITGQAFCLDSRL